MCRQFVGICLVKLPTQQHRLIRPPSLRLQTPADSRHRRGRRHSFVNILLTACWAVLTGARPFAAIGQWARSAPWYALARLGALAPTVFDARIAPSAATTRRVLNAACPGGMADLLGSIRRGPKPSWWTARTPGDRTTARSRPPICWQGHRRPHCYPAAGAGQDEWNHRLRRVGLFWTGCGGSRSC
ncbi:transposase family protein [Streptomyces sp. NBC_01622]|uniref:transposase family protein n=1 Tax=Streptomyces sp. NBC_01622 TaxID=2975903 RepID=UPI0038653B0E|nr:transposase family protein [Streptomyces sp. NBC_01622]